MHSLQIAHVVRIPPFDERVAKMQRPVAFPTGDAIDWAACADSREAPPEIDNGAVPEHQSQASRVISGRLVGGCKS